MVMAENEAKETADLKSKMDELRKREPNDHTPHFILANYYMEKGLYHEALATLEALEGLRPGERYLLDRKRDILAKVGLREK